MGHTDLGLLGDRLVLGGLALEEKDPRYIRWIERRRDLHLPLAVEEHALPIQARISWVRPLLRLPERLGSRADAVLDDHLDRWAGDNRVDLLALDRDLAEKTPQRFWAALRFFQARSYASQASSDMPRTRLGFFGIFSSRRARMRAAAPAGSAPPFDLIPMVFWMFPVDGSQTSLRARPT